MGGLLVGDRISAIYIGVSKHTFAPSAEAAEVERKLGSAHGTVHLTVTRPTTASGEFDVVVHKDHPEDKVGLSVSSVTGDASGLPWVETVTTDSRAAHSGHTVLAVQQLWEYPISISYCTKLYLRAGARAGYSFHVALGASACTCCSSSAMRACALSSSSFRAARFSPATAAAATAS